MTYGQTGAEAFAFMTELVAEQTADAVDGGNTVQTDEASGIALTEPVADAGGGVDVAPLPVRVELERTVLEGQVHGPLAVQRHGELGIEVPGGKCRHVGTQTVELGGHGPGQEQQGDEYQCLFQHGSHFLSTLQAVRVL